MLSELVEVHLAIIHASAIRQGCVTRAQPRTPCHEQDEIYYRHYNWFTRQGIKENLTGKLTSSISYNVTYGRPETSGQFFADHVPVDFTFFAAKAIWLPLSFIISVSYTVRRCELSRLVAR